MVKLLGTKIVSIVLLLSMCLLLSTMSLTEVSATEYALTDYATDIPYSVSIDSYGYIGISSEKTSCGFYSDTPVLSCCVYKGVFSFLAYTESSSGYCASVYTYDIKNNDLTYTLTSLKIFPDETRFAVNADGAIYLVDFNNNSIINCYYNNNIIYSIDVNATVKQILCIDGTHLTVIANGGVYLIDGQSIEYTGNVSLAVPCKYTGDAFVTDADENLFTYDNGKVIRFEPVTEADTINDPLKLQTQFVIKDNCIYTEANTTVAKLYKGLGITKNELNVYKKDGTAYPQGKLGTGMTAVFGSKTYNIVILGELTGEGNINSRDLKLMMKFITGEESPDNFQALSADMNGDGAIDTKDLLALSKLY